jgi:hypothetical protein
MPPKDDDHFCPALFDIVRLLRIMPTLISLLENDWVELRSGNSQYKIVALPKDNFPSIPEASSTIAIIPGALLRSMIQRTMFAITQEESRYSLNGALLALLPNEVRMVATDGHRLALVSRRWRFPDWIRRCAHIPSSCRNSEVDWGSGCQSVHGMKTICFSVGRSSSYQSFSWAISNYDW